MDDLDALFYGQHIDATQRGRSYNSIYDSQRGASPAPQQSTAYKNFSGRDQAPLLSSPWQAQNTRPVSLNTPHSLVLPRCTPSGSTTSDLLRLKPVTEIPEAYRQVFPFPYFNAVQSQVLDDVLYTDQPMVLCAPTGSGKTAVFELAIIRQLMKQQTGKVVYMAPMKALCSERYEDWSSKFGPLGLQCKELTGDTELDDYFDLQDVHIILTTPEKWDSTTRRWRDNQSLVQQVTLFLIDEVHLLNDTNRGATMEAVVSRMKTVQTALAREKTRLLGGAALLRLIAVSATIPNVEDIASWLGGERSQALHHSMDDSCRPVRLRKVVLGFPCSQTQSEFRFDLSLNYKLAHVIETYSENKPTLVFGATRKSVSQAAATLVRDARFILDAQHKLRLQRCANAVRDAKLRELILQGVAFHHAGLDMQDRKLVEAAFTQGDIPVLVATSTLAMGVNLPAHLVVIKSTQHYVMSSYEEYSESQILQMIGRAGRPQFDTTATAVIMTRTSTKHKYDALLNGTQLIESSLHQNLVEHLNAEITLKTISDVAVAMEWLQSTFLYIRVLKNPKHYGVPEGLSTEEVNTRLQDLCMQNLNKLAGVDLIQMDGDGFILQSTELGRQMARYCVAFETMKKLKDAAKTETLQEMLDILCSSQEFQDIQLRTNEKKTLNALNKDKNRPTVRYELQGKIKTNTMKVNCLIQAQLGCLPLQDFALSQDLNRIFRSALRISKCLVEVLWQESSLKAFLNAALLCKSIKAKLWENSKHVGRQLPGIGPTLSTALVNAGVCSFQQLEERNPRELELIMNRHPPFGNQIREAVSRLPKYELCLDQSTQYSASHADITLSVGLTNADTISEKSTAGTGHSCLLIIGDADNKVTFKARISDRQLLRSGTWTKRVSVRRAVKGEELSINLISQDLVGLDVQSTYTPFYTGPKRVSSSALEFQQREQQARHTLPLKPAGTNGAAMLQPTILPPGRRPCSHTCMDKQSCAHECCKNGVPIKAGKSTIDKFRSQLKHRLAAIPTTPSVKRCKLDSQPTRLDLQQFAYTPHRRLPGMKPADSGRAIPTLRPSLDEEAYYTYIVEDFQNNFYKGELNPSTKPPFWCSSDNDIDVPDDELPDLTTETDVYASTNSAGEEVQRDQTEKRVRPDVLQCDVNIGIFPRSLESDANYKNTSRSIYQPQTTMPLYLMNKQTSDRTEISAQPVQTHVQYEYKASGDWNRPDSNVSSAQRWANASPAGPTLARRWANDGSTVLLSGRKSKHQPMNARSESYQISPDYVNPQPPTQTQARTSTSNKVFRFKSIFVTTHPKEDSRNQQASTHHPRRSTHNLIEFQHSTNMTNANDTKDRKPCTTIRENCISTQLHKDEPFVLQGSCYGSNVGISNVPPPRLYQNMKDAHENTPLATTSKPIASGQSNPIIAAGQTPAVRKKGYGHGRGNVHGKLEFRKMKPKGVVYTDDLDDRDKGGDKIAKINVPSGEKTNFEDEWEQYALQEAYMYDDEQSEDWDELHYNNHTQQVYQVKGQCSVRTNSPGTTNEVGRVANLTAEDSIAGHLRHVSSKRRPNFPNPQNSDTPNRETSRFTSAVNDLRSSTTISSMYGVPQTGAIVQTKRSVPCGARTCPPTISRPSIPDVQMTIKHAYLEEETRAPTLEELFPECRKTNVRTARASNDISGAKCWDEVPTQYTVNSHSGNTPIPGPMRSTATVHHPGRNGNQGKFPGSYGYSEDYEDDQTSPREEMPQVRQEPFSTCWNGILSKTRSTGSHRSSPEAENQVDIFAGIL